MKHMHIIFDENSQIIKQEEVQSPSDIWNLKDELTLLTKGIPSEYATIFRSGYHKSFIKTDSDTYECYLHRGYAHTSLAKTSWNYSILYGEIISETREHISDYSSGNADWYSESWSVVVKVPAIVKDSYHHQIYIIYKENKLLKAIHRVQIDNVIYDFPIQIRIIDEKYADAYCPICPFIEKMKHLTRKSLLKVLQLIQQGYKIDFVFENQNLYLCRVPLLIQGKIYNKDGWKAEKETIFLDFDKVYVVLPFVPENAEEEEV